MIRSFVWTFRIIALCFIGCLWLSGALNWLRQSAVHSDSGAPPGRLQQNVGPSRFAPHQVPTLVIASQLRDNITWLQDALPTWDLRTYVTDDPRASLKVPANKGREAMVYLTYIIDNYHRLPPVTVFHHAGRYQWHNDDPLYDGLRVLRRLQVVHVRDVGYANLRCVWTLGCPSEIRPHVEELERPTEVPREEDSRVGWFYKRAFQELFPGEAVPSEVGAACCAQFAVADWAVRRRPKHDYERFRQWLLDTNLSDHVSGRILEYTWHLIFGMDAVSCPDARSCYCSLYGLCDLVCEEEGVCGSQYSFPLYSDLPEGWPDFDWDGHWQNAEKL